MPSTLKAPLHGSPQEVGPGRVLPNAHARTDLGVDLTQDARPAEEDGAEANPEPPQGAVGRSEPLESSLQKEEKPSLQKVTQSLTPVLNTHTHLAPILDLKDSDDQRKVIQLALSHLQKKPCNDFVKLQRKVKSVEAELTQLKVELATKEGELKATSKILNNFTSRT
jgi:hypothetical protein